MNNATVNTLKNADELKTFVEQALPNYSVTGLAKHLRKVKPDPASHGKSIIIWYGCPKITELIELRVTTALRVYSVDRFNSDIALATQDELQKAWDKRCKRIEKNNERRLALAAKKVAQANRNEKRRLQRKLKKEMAIPAEKIKVNVEDPLEVTQPVEA